MKVAAVSSAAFLSGAHASIVPFYSQRKHPAPCLPGKLCKPHPGLYTGMELLIDLSVGGQQQRVQFDTGSSDLALFCKQCGDQCGKHVFKPYDFASSGSMVKCDSKECGSHSKCYDGDATNLVNGCEFVNGYGDGSNFKAVVFEDAFGLWGEDGTTKINVGAIIDQHGGPGQPSFEGEECDGILGTGFMTISESDPAAKNNPIVALAKAEGKPGIFSMCFAQGGGAFGIGEELPYYTGEFVTEPVLPERGGRRSGGKHGYWSVKVQDVRIYGESVGVAASEYTKNECIVDSGTTVMMLPENAIDYIAHAILDNCDKAPLVGMCLDDKGQRINPEKQAILLYGGNFKLTPEQIAQYPGIDIVMSNSTVTVAPESYIVCIDDPQEGHTCIALLQPGEMTMLGDGFLGGLTTVYDQDNMNIRFAKAQGCPGPASLLASKARFNATVIV